MFTDISFGISEGQKIGFVAKNGTGKTSLLNILSGADQPDQGNVIYRNGLKVEFLAQEPNLNPELSIEETIFASDNDTLKIIERYATAPRRVGASRSFLWPLIGVSLWGGSIRVL